LERLNDQDQALAKQAEEAKGNPFMQYHGEEIDSFCLAHCAFSHDFDAQCAKLTIPA
jgi:hypothetical protein